MVLYILRAVDPKTGSSELQKAMCHAVIKFSGSHFQTEINTSNEQAFWLPARKQIAQATAVGVLPSGDSAQSPCAGAAVFLIMLEPSINEPRQSRNPVNKVQGILKD